MKAPLPPNETKRLEALALYQILDTLPDGELDEITRVAAHICGCPIASISLIAEQRQWYKSKIGMDATETPRDLAFCAHTILGEKPLIVEDATQDKRFADNPVVLEKPNVRFYAGIPLTNRDGYNLGTLCVVDVKPRRLTDAQTLAIEALSRHVITHLEMRRVLIERAKAEAEVQRLNESLERRVAERTAELEAAYEELKVASQAKTEFLTNMSHEIRTPLNAIIGLTDVMVGTPLNAEQKDFLETIHANGENLLTIVNDVLDFSKIEFGKMELEVRPFELAALLDEVMNMFRFRATQRHLTLECVVQTALPRWYLGDAPRIRQILINLVSNGIKFTERGGIRIEVEGPAPTDHSGPRQIIFRVRDTGIGIAPGRREVLFKAFSQLDASTTRTYGGSGLGLAICQKLTGLMGGTIGLESQCKQGSVFIVTIPLAVAAAPGTAVLPPPVPPVEEPARPASAFNILLVEDNLTNQKVAQSILRRLGYQADVANHGLEAVAAVGTKQYDLIFMDVHMPHMDGFAATRQIRRMKLGRHPRIVALTADVLKGEREKCLDAGMDQYASKPTRLEVLASIIQDVQATECA